MIRLLLATFIFTTFMTHADVHVVVHPSNADTFDVTTVSRIFMGKNKSFPSGQPAIPVNQTGNKALLEEFNDKVLNKSSSQIKAYWSKLLFTGKGQPPQQVVSEAEIVDLVSKNPNIIGFVSGDSAQNSNLKVVLSL
ncbi:phosphate ABC transporter substrate-binding protein [Aestuariibacter sp. AA17]|uniref:Phosphate ABC transporter substrate-binding protein n=1 Tax=Fluctibacter corallii TaxID=2984329 RepID=A0ABT3A9K0_9ALTE|nr:phosphate ABC transporter substrate-binding protein [Aestuariibacter sp. AA17]MCV2885279.1 phosphate ABC transporter substrate-binding protein [Aestuariibacter sp. AA17]